MFWAGRINVKSIFGSLFKKEQAPSSSAPDGRIANKRLSDQQRRRLEQKLQAWIDAKGYCLPDRTVADAASRIGTHSLLLYRYFAQQGTDFRTWRSQLRIQDAKEQLLAYPGVPASVIGRRVGITDRSNFTRQFKAFVGELPDTWRNNQK